MILVTGCAGFIGYHTCLNLLAAGHKVIGIDNLSTYYDVRLKNDRLARLQQNSNFSFEKIDISDKDSMIQFGKNHTDIIHIIHLAAQAGVRHSLIDPYIYVQTNLMGQLCLLELAKSLPNLKHMVYASTSSVYGANTKMPFSESDRTDNPVSLYAASKKGCEVMAESYARMFNLPITGLRYFTVYGPFGRPDMALFQFTKAILADEPIEVFNNGEMFRNFTFVEDIAQGTCKCLFQIRESGNHRVYNIGNKQSETLMDYVGVLENCLGKKATILFKPMQNGDVKGTKADISDAVTDFDFDPKTNITAGIPQFVDWYRAYYKE